LQIDPGEFYREVQATWKLGIRFLWGPRPSFNYTFGRQMDWKWEKLAKNNGFYCEDNFDYVDLHSALMMHDMVFVRQANGDPLIGRNFGIHIENHRFVAYLEKLAGRLGVQIVDDTVNEVRRDGNGVAALHLASGAVQTADLYVDSSGFRSLLLGQSLGEPFVSFAPSLFCDRAVAGGWDRAAEIIKPYTTAETMNSGWCWQIEHEDRIHRGYVYSSAFISDADAEEEIRAKNPKFGSSWLVRFRSGRHRLSWVQNVVAIGNASGFVEPLEATALAVICDQCRFVADTLADCDRQLNQTLINNYNGLVALAWDGIRNFLSIHYKFNRRLDTPFWRACLQDVDLAGARGLVDYFHENGPSTYARNTLIHGTDIFGLEGYLAMLVGQKVPYRKVHHASDEELRIWEAIRAEHRAKALAGFTTPDAFAAIRAPSWKWNPEFYGSGPTSSP
jgi:tryptophan halogenase